MTLSSDLLCSWAQPHSPCHRLLSAGISDALGCGVPS
ncbi:hypothetical protein LEMLEM_LOCUS27308 [Lemmus lemmus]